MLSVLRKRTVALLWFGQATSAIGDEIYRVALTWVAVGLMGTKTGYLSATQAAAFLLFGVLGGRWVDRRDHFKTLIAVDLLRALIVVVPVILFHFMGISFPVLVVVAFLVAGLASFFDPALIAVVPGLSDSSDAMKATTGLMATTVRLARAVGPSVVGALSLSIPMIHFFTVDSATFLVSAFSVFLMSRFLARGGPKHEAGSKHPPNENVTSGFQLLSQSPLVKRILILKSFGGGLWYLGYALGIPLLVQIRAPGDLRAYGFSVAAYGVGNFAGALWIGSMSRKNPVAMLSWGYVWLGAGFIAMACAPTLWILAAASAWTGFGGPLNDLPMVDMIQSNFRIRDIPKIFRLRLMGEIFFSLLITLLSPTLFQWLSVGTVILFSGVIFGTIAVYGFYLCQKDVSLVVE